MNTLIQLEYCNKNINIFVKFQNDLKYNLLKQKV